MNSDKKFPVSPQMITLAIILLFCITGCILTFAFMARLAIFMAAFIVSVLAALYRRKHGKKETIVKIVSDIIVIVGIALFLLSMPPMTMSSPLLWQYPFQKKLMDMYHNVKEPDFVPDFRGAVKGDYYFDYLPSMLQGAGYYSVRFTADTAQAQEYERMFSARAVHTFDFDDEAHDYYGNYFSRNVQLGENDVGSVDVYIDREFFSSGNARIYVIETNYNWNHPHTSAVIIDSAVGKVQFSRNG